MAEPTPQDMTQLLEQIRLGDAAAAQRLFPLVYDELRALAKSFFQRQHGHQTLQPTALVHDAYLRMVDQTNVKWNDRAHFFAVAARAMRQILIDHARRKKSLKRGGDVHRVAMDEALAVCNESDVALIDLDSALQKLSTLDERKCRVVELRFFAGLTNEETAEVLGISRATVADDWTVARAFLKSELNRGESS
jgi:RNA polymerase sigma factor (TIGR02999 family)